MTADCDEARELAKSDGCRRTYITPAAITARTQTAARIGNSFEPERGEAEADRATDDIAKFASCNGGAALVEDDALNVCNSPKTGRTGLLRELSDLRGAALGRRPGIGIFSAAGAAAGAGVSTSAATADSTDEEVADGPARGSICSFCQFRARP